VKTHPPLPPLCFPFPHPCAQVNIYNIDGAGAGGARGQRARTHPCRPPPRGSAAQRGAVVLRYRLMQAITHMRFLLDTKHLQQDDSYNTDDRTDFTAPEPPVVDMPQVRRGYPADA